MGVNIVFAFLAILSTCSAESGLRLLFPQPQRQYVYVLKANVSAGTIAPRESSSYWSMEARLLIQVYDNFTKARMQLENLKKMVYCKDGGAKSFLATDDEKYITEPWELEYQENGVISSIYVGQEPVWSTNIKRALSVNFQLTKNVGTYSLSEPCLDDICVMIYSAKGDTITKYTSYRVPNPRSGNSWSSVPRGSYYTGHSYVDSASSAERVYRLQEKGLIDLDLKGSYQHRSYDHILAVNSDLSLYYLTDVPSRSVEKLNLSQKTLQYCASDYGDPTNGIRNFSQDHLRNKTYEILFKIASKGIDADNIVRNATLIHNLHFIELLNTISRLNYDTLIKLFGDLVLGTSYELETSRNIFLEVLPHARSDHCARFIRYLVLEQKEKLEDAALLSLIRKLPFNVDTPSQSLIEELEVLTKLSLDFPPEIRYAGILSFATLVHKSIDLSQVKQDYIDKIVVKYFRMYSDCPQYLDRMIWLQGLCNIGFSAESYIRIIHTDSGRDRHERLWTALGGNPKTEEPYVVLETTLPILTNESEHIQLRIMSLHMFLSSPNIRESDFLFIHNYVKESGNDQLRRFWNVTVKSLESNRHFSDYSIASYYVPFVSNQVSTPDLLHWATNNYIVSGHEDAGAPSLQLLSVGDPMGAMPEFIGLRLSTGGRRPYKVEIYFILEGVTTSMFRKLDDFKASGLNVERLTQLLKKMKNWVVKSPEKVHVDIVMKVHEKTVFATHMNQSRFESWNEEYMKKSIEDFLRFGSHINQQIVYYPFQTDIHIPSELGTPIRQQSTILSFNSIRGNLTALWNDKITWRNDLHIRYQGSSMTSLSTDGPLLQTLHTARIQQSMVAHLPMKFNISVSSTDKSLELTWPTPSSQQGGVAMHHRALISMETMDEVFKYAVTTRDREQTENGSSIFFDCERPLTEQEVLEKFLTPQTNKYAFLTTLHPSLIILNSILLFTSPPSGSCGVILPPHRMIVGDDVLQFKIQFRHMSMSEESSKMEVLFLLNYYSQQDPANILLKIEAISKEETSGNNKNFQLTVRGSHPKANDSSQRDWTICLREQEILHTTSDQDITTKPAAYEGHMTLSYSQNQTVCFEKESTSEMTLKYRGVPKTTNGKTNMLVEVKIFGRNLSRISELETSLFGQSHLGHQLESYDDQPLNITAVLKEKDGMASLNINKGSEIRFKSEHFAWLLDSWTNMQIWKSFGFYRECRIQESAIQTLSGRMVQLTSAECPENLILGDCSQSPRFAVLQQKDGTLKVYSGNNHMVVTAGVVTSALDKSSAGAQFRTTLIGDTLKITPYLTDLELYHRSNETVILVPHFLMTTICGVCVDVHTYDVC